MLTLSALQRKEVVMMHTGEKLGYIDDLEIDEQDGVITSIIVINRHMKGSFFNKVQEIVIDWNQIVTIGADIILINDEAMTEKVEEKEEEKEVNSD